MKEEDQQKLFSDIKSILANEPAARFAIVGHTPFSYDLHALFSSVGAESCLLGIYGEETPYAASKIKPMRAP